MASPTRVSVLAVASALVVTACASSGRIADDSACFSGLAPASRSLNAALDSATLSRELSTAWDDSAGLTIATLAYNPISRRDSVVVYSASMAQEARQQLGTLVARHAVPEGRGNLFYLLLGTDAGPELRSVQELRTCRPVLRNEAVLSSLIDNESRGLMLFRDTTVPVDALVDVSGQVAEVRLERPSTVRGVDDAALRIMRVGNFIPARIEGIPIASWVRLPIRFQSLPDSLSQRR